MKQVAALVAFFALMLWLIVGNPPNDVANVLWAQSAAPWESVTGFYYPNRSNTEDVKTQASGTLSQCRDWAQVTIAASIDPEGLTSNYLCGVVCKNVNDPTTCRVQLH